MTKKMKILLVEDEIFLGQIVTETLSSRGFELRHESSGNAIIEAFQQFKPDICLFDIMLPGKDGFTLLEEIRRINRQVPVIFLTAKSMSEDVVKGFEKGCNDYIRKPFSMEELIVRINALLQRTAVTSDLNEQFVIGEYTFYYTRQELIYKGEVIKLTGREADLLKLLVQHKNNLMDKKKALLELWGDDSFFNNRSMDVFITKLRKYLSKDTTVSILNIRGMGYKLIF